MNIPKLATLNISRTRVEMLHEFLREQGIDILYIQEVTHLNLGELHRFTTHNNVRTSMRGTAFVTRNEIQLSSINILPSGRWMAEEFREITLINIYAPSGTTKWREKNISMTAN